MLPMICVIECPDDEDLITDFYLKHRGLMYNEARKTLDISEDVEDTVYEALVKIIDKMPIFRELQPKQQVQYALTTVRNLSYILLRRNKHFTMIPLEDLDADIPVGEQHSTENIVENKLLNAYIMQVWSQINIEDRMLLEQKYILHWKDEELAGALGIQPPSVRMRLTRAKRNVLKELQNKGIDLSDW